MTLLVEKLTAIKSHWRGIAAELGQSLPRSGGNYYHQEDPTVAVANIACSNFPHEVAQREMGGQAVVVPLLLSSLDEPPLYWLSWREEWSRDQSSRAVKFKLRTSALTVYYGEAGSPKRQVLRAEWTGADNYREDIGRYTFQADGAAHPHWHVDGVRSHFDDIARQFELMSADEDLRRGLAGERIREFGGEDLEHEIGALFEQQSLSLPSADELCWTRIHLASSAKWSESSWPGRAGPHDTHAQSPANFDQIKNWLGSCVRYLQAQIQDQLLNLR